MKKAFNFFTLILLHLLAFHSSAQLEFSKWYFGQGAGLDFATSPPTALSNGAITGGEGVATVCDNTGNLLFYTDGTFVRNANHAMMANGTGLTGGMGSTTQDALTVQKPGSDSLYYIFTLQVNAGNLYHSIVDMSLAAGLGSVTVKNALVYNNSCEKQTAVRHCNGKDIWILSHEYGTNNFRAYLLDQNGLSNTPVISSIGPVPTGTSIALAGQLKASPDGKKLAMASAWNSQPSSAGFSGFYLFDFDPSSGIVSNSLTLNNAICAYGLEFSPDGTKLFGSTTTLFTVTTSYLYQWNICAPNNSAILASQYSITIGNYIGGALQRAIDNKIYLSISGQQSISVIHNPNLSGAAMSFSLLSLTLVPPGSVLGLPQWINPYTKPSFAPFNSQASCQSVNFQAPVAQSFSQGCSPVTYVPTGYLWDFGEPSSGSNNTSTLSNPSHLYSALGTYTVKLILQGPCAGDTLVQTVNITTLGPTPAVAGPSLICKGDRYTYTVSGGSTYQWSTGATSNTVALNPTLTTVYTVSASTNGCTQSKTFTVTVNPCLGLEDLQAAGLWKVFPNPVVNELYIESAVEGSLRLFDLNGRVVFEAKLQQGKNIVSTSGLNAGVYCLQLSKANVTHHLRIVKVE